MAAPVCLRAPKTSSQLFIEERLSLSPSSVATCPSPAFSPLPDSPDSLHERIHAALEAVRAGVPVVDLVAYCGSPQR